MDVILKYFQQLSPRQVQQLEALSPLYLGWNEKINVISRKDIDHLYLHHVLHSLAIGRYVKFKPGAAILDIGTGGGFPGIPLAILFPETEFTLIDGTLKKIKVVQAVTAALELKNVQALQTRAEEWKGKKFDFVVSRAVADLDQLYAWALRLLKPKHQHAIPNGLIALKGGDLKPELKMLPRGSYTEVLPIQTFFGEEYFSEKFVVYVQG
jgi:16S rRNA (guanine527-N7)-methyltransferase